MRTGVEGEVVGEPLVVRIARGRRDALDADVHAGCELLGHVRAPSKNDVCVLPRHAGENQMRSRVRFSLDSVA